MLNGVPVLDPFGEGEIWELEPTAKTCISKLQPNRQYLTNTNEELGGSAFPQITLFCVIAITGAFSIVVKDPLYPSQPLYDYDVGVSCPVEFSLTFVVPTDASDDYDKTPLRLLPLLQLQTLLLRQNSAGPHSGLVPYDQNHRLSSCA